MMPVDPPRSDAERYAAEIAALVVEHGEVPPLWAYYPRIHPFDIHWRMGGGEDYRYLFHAWADALAWPLDARVAYVRRWDPPFSWLENVAAFLWPEDFSDDESEISDEHFNRMEALGLGSRADWSRCFEIAPEDYPLADDTSSRWLVRIMRQEELKQCRVGRCR